MVLLPKIQASVQPLLERQADLRWAYLFGSCARGADGRDVDLAVMPRDSAYASGVAWGSLIADLEAAVGAKVDLVDLRSASLPLAGTLLTERVVLLDRERDARHAWEADTTSRWLDFKPAYERAALVRLEAMRARLSGAG